MAETPDSVIIVLGYKNQADGTLHPITLQRADKALELARHNNSKLICTGGFGNNFNQSKTAHGLLVQQYLESRGIEKQRFLPHAPSRNTYEDGRLCADILASVNVTKMLAVTSDFHIKRGFLWLHHFCPGMKIVCCPSKTIADDVDMRNVLAHEAQAIPKFYSDFPETPSLEKLYNFDELDLPF